MITMKSEWREMLPTWAFAVLLPAPMATFWHEGPGRDFAYAYLFLGCSLLAAERFRKGAESYAREKAEQGAGEIWRIRMMSLSTAMLAAVGVFSGFAWAIAGEWSFSIPLFALLAVIPALSAIPYFVMSTGKEYGAILLVVFCLALIKLAGCVIVRVVYGPNALPEGRMNLPWEEPNLLVWFCLGGMLGLSAVCGFLGQRLFVRGEKRLDHVAIR